MCAGVYVYMNVDMQLPRFTTHWVVRFSIRNSRDQPEACFSNTPDHHGMEKQSPDAEKQPRDRGTSIPRP